MNEPVILKEAAIAADCPCEIELEAGKAYFFCTCGLSKEQPFCDGSHKGTGFKSLKFSAIKSEKAWLCQCKRSGELPFCDGTHKKLAK